MREVGVLEAKTSFSSLIAEVERTGEAVTVTRHGRAAVRIVSIRPPGQDVSGEERRELAEDIIAWRDAQPVPDGFEGMSWEEAKRLTRDEDDHG